MVVNPMSGPFIVISATFTADAIEPTLSFWMRELGFDYHIQIAPYNQVFQLLLDPAGALASNRDGVNVVLVRFADWAHAQDSAAPDPARLEAASRTPSAMGPSKAGRTTASASSSMAGSWERLSAARLQPYRPTWARKP